MGPDQKKIKRLGLWAIFLIAVGGVAAFFVPTETAGLFFALLRDIITNLLL